MMSLKELIKKITQAFEYQEVQCTTNSTVSGGGIYASKRSGIVTLKINGTKMPVLSSRTQIGTVPAGFRPCTEVYGFINGMTTNEYIVINTVGAIFVNRVVSAGVKYGTLTYVASGGGTA